MQYANENINTKTARQTKKDVTMNNLVEQQFLATHPKGTVSQYAHWLRIRREIKDL